MVLVTSSGSVVVNYMLQMAKTNSTQLVDSVVKAITDSDDSFAGSQVGSVKQSGEFTFVQSLSDFN